MKKVAIIGSGFSGMSAAAYLAKGGYEVDVFEKNNSHGGRARNFKTENGFLFDMGPSWYWMPDVFDNFLKDFSLQTKDFYELIKLDPAFEIVFGKNDKLTIPSDYNELEILFETIEPGSADKLNKFMSEAAFKYKTGMQDLVFKPGLSIIEYANPELLWRVFQLQVFSSFSAHLKRFFSHPKLISLMEFPVLFLGAMPRQTPALYSLMNYAGLKMGTWYPMGGFGKVTDAMKTIAEWMGARFYFNCNVEKINVQEGNANSILIDGSNFKYDAIISSADYNFTEQNLLNEEYRNYDGEYWESRTLSPSSLIFYLGINKKIPALTHHTLFFDEDLTQHSRDIYLDKQWPEKPLFYVCCPSKTDPDVAPFDYENLFILIPIAPGLKDTKEIREKYFKIIIGRLNEYCGININDHIIYKKSYCVKDFEKDYNSFKGNAYGLANTLKQTAFLKPKIKNRKVQNLFYTGQLTVPGPGVPPAIISGKIVAEQVIKQLEKQRNEIIV